MAATRAAQNKKIRQDALREQLAKQKHIEHVVDIAHKLTDQYETLESSQVQALRAAADIRCKMIDKYLPSLKATELSTIDEAGNVTGFKIEVMNVKNSTAD